MRSAKIWTVGMLAAAVAIGCDAGNSGTNGAGPSLGTATDAKALTALPSPGSAGFTAAVAVNEANTAAGWTVGPAGARGISWSVSGEQGSLAAEHLPIAGNSHSAAYGVGSAGHVVGESQLGSTSVAVAWLGGATSPTQLRLDGFSTPAVAFASAGNRIVGQATLGGRTVAVLWRTPSSAPEELDTIDSDGTSQAYAISADGRIVVGEATDDGARRGAVWVLDEDGDVDDGPDPLNPLPGDVASIAFGVDGNTIVGESIAADGSSRAVSWTRSAGGNLGNPVELGPGSASGVSGARVVGVSGDDAATLWSLQGATPVDLATAPSQALGINALGTVVGYEGTGAFVHALGAGAPAPATGVVVTPSVTSPAEVGTAVTFTAQGIGGTGTYEYQFYFKTLPDGAFSIVQPYSTNASWTMPLDTPAGDYRVLVYVRTNPNVFKDAQGGANFTLREGKVTGVTVVASAPSPQPAGTPVTFAAQAQGGSGTVQYRFYWKELSAPAYTMVQDYSEQNTWTIPAETAPGNYRVLVYARAGTSGPQGAQAGMNYTVSPAKATGVTLAASAPSPQPASAGVTFTAQGEGGSGTYQYRFYWKEQTAPSYTIVQDYGAQNTWTIPANTPPGNYRVMAYVRTATSGAQDAMVGMNYTVRTDPATGLAVTATPSGPQPQGVPVTFNAVATGGSGTYQYKFHFKPLSAAAYTVVQDWSTDSSWQSASDLAPGDYRVLVYVRTGTTGSYDVMAGRNFTVLSDSLAAQ